MRAGWTVEALGNLCDVLDSQRKPITKKDRQPGEYPYYGATGIQDYVDGFLFDEPLVLVGEDGAKWDVGESTAFSVEGKCWVNNHAHVLRPHRKILIDNWLIHYFFHTDLTQFVSGLTVPKLTQGSLREIPIPLPPVAEQRRIVSILDEAFDGIATAKANAEKNLQNARALFESHLDATFGQSGNGWLSSTLEEVVDASCTLSYGIVQPGDECSDGLPIVRPTDLTTKLIKLDGLKRIKAELAAGYKRTALRGGELLLCVRGSTGVISIAAAELLGANVTRGIVPIRFDEARVLQNFGYHLMTAGLVQGQIREKTYGTALMQINIGDLRKVDVSFPSINEQARIAAALDVMAEETRRLESIYQRKLAALDELKQSLLHQAFSGAL
ncbi:MAG: restriction endonuclease subunit S [Burkholderiales bacterium]|jgi:type I restriction enzyme S subunit|nr:restriction endonuclease subunit S [Burkholderiales bacterium]